MSVLIPDMILAINIIIIININQCLHPHFPDTIMHFFHTVPKYDLKTDKGPAHYMCGDVCTNVSKE